MHNVARDALPGQKVAWSLERSGSCGDMNCVLHFFLEDFTLCLKYNNKIKLYRVSEKECARIREGVPYVKIYRYNPKHLCPKLNGYGDKGARKVWCSCGYTYCTWFA